MKTVSSFRKQLFVLFLIAAVFAAFNLSMYAVFTCRLANNFSDTSQAKMVDVENYLPFEEGSDLPLTGTSLRLEGDLPVLDGAAALVPVYAAVIQNIYPEGSVTYEGGVFSDDNFYGENFAEDSVMRYNNTVRGYTAIVDGDTDILFCAAPSAEQAAYAEEKGVELVYVPIGREAFVFMVNRNNPADSLTVDEVRSIYGGDITNWSEVGGPWRPINPVTRMEGSGSQTAMNAFMGDTAFDGKSPLALFGGSIGFSFRYYMNDMVANENVKMLALNGVYPSAENIQNGTYPVVAEFYAIYRADNENENIPILIDWLLSEEGQRLIEETGYVRVK